MSDRETPRVFTTRKAAVYISMSESFLRQSRMDSSTVSPPLPYIKIGRSVRYLKSDLDEWLLAQKENSISDSVESGNG